MKPVDLLLHLYFERRDGQWLAYCLDFTLVAQADSLEVAASKLHAQVVEYVQDATVGEDRQHAAYLLRRRAPFLSWLKFYYVLARQSYHESKRRKATKEPMPLAPCSA